MFAQTHLKLGLIQQHGCGPQLLSHMLAFVVWKNAMQRGTLQHRLAHSDALRLAVEFMSPAPITSCSWMLGCPAASTFSVDYLR